MTTIVNNDFDSNKSFSSAHSVSFKQVGVTRKLLDCQVVLLDVLYTSSTEKFQTLNFNLDKTHRVNFRQILDSHYLNKLFQKNPIAWPKMSHNNSWEQLDSAVSNLLVGAASVFERVELLDKSIYDQGSLLFGLLPRKEKSPSSLNRTAQHSIKLGQKRMSFWPELIVPLINVPKIPCRFCWKTFTKDFESSAVVSLAGKNIGK